MSNVWRGKTRKYFLFPVLFNLINKIILRDMKPVKNRFSEVEHWLNFLQRWEIETREPIPEQAIISLEVAFDKLLYDYRKQSLKQGNKINIEYSMH